jgi:uncharacterized membrane protein
MGAGHSHQHGADAEDAFDGRLRRQLTAIAAAIAAVTLLGVAFFWPSGQQDLDLASLGVADAYFDATVTRVENFTCPGEEGLDGDDAGPPEGPTTTEGPYFQGIPSLCQNVSFRLDQGPDAGEERSVELFDVGPYPSISVGDGVVVPYLEDALPEFQYTQAFERERRLPMVLLAAAFAALVIVQGRLRGLAALAGLVASISVIILFVLPALVEGSPPVPVALVAASLIAYLALYLAHGINPLTTVALLGSLGSLALVGVLSWMFTRLTVLSGLGEEAQFIRAFGGDLDFSGLLLAGMILGSLGALDDMTVTQASAVAELKVANPRYGFRDLYRAGGRIGRDHVASTVNTLALAYAGAALPLLLLFVESGRPFSRVLTSEVVAAEVVRTLVGSIGLVASVPLTTALAARLVGGRDEGGHDHGPDAEAGAGPAVRRRRLGRPVVEPPEDGEPDILRK